MTDSRNALVVDDNPTNRLIAATLLRKLGWTVSEADCGEGALARVDVETFRLVLLDISMPGLSGEETCLRLRERQSAPPLHILAYTAHAFQEDTDRLLATGFDAVLVKPINRQRLAELVAGL